MGPNQSHTRIKDFMDKKDREKDIEIYIVQDIH